MDTAVFGAAAGMYDCTCAAIGVGSLFNTGAGGVRILWGVKYSCSSLMLVSKVIIGSGEDEGLT